MEHASTQTKTGNLTVQELTVMVAAKEIDTVIIAFTDMQGRLVGKRASARLFLEELAEHGAELIELGAAIARSCEATAA